MADQTITLPMSTIKKYAVWVDHSRSSCANCNAPFERDGAVCRSCGTPLIFALSVMALFAEDLKKGMRNFAAENGLVLIEESMR